VGGAALRFDCDALAGGGGGGAAAKVLSPLSAASLGVGGLTVPTGEGGGGATGMVATDEGFPGATGAVLVRGAGAAPVAGAGAGP